MDVLLFDFNGLLADSEPVYHTCWQKIIEPLGIQTVGIQLDWDYYRKFCVGITEQRMVRR